MLAIQNEGHYWVWFLYRHKNDKNTILGFEYAKHIDYIRYYMGYNNIFSEYCVII